MKKSVVCWDYGEKCTMKHAKEYMDNWETVIQPLINNATKDVIYSDGIWDIYIYID